MLLGGSQRGNLRLKRCQGVSHINRQPLPVRSKTVLAQNGEGFAYRLIAAFNLAFQVVEQRRPAGGLFDGSGFHYFHRFRAFARDAVR